MSLTLKDWEDRLDGFQRAGSQYKALCPAHEDTTHSLSIKETPDGKVLIHCHAGCSYQEILEATDQAPKALIDISWGELRRPEKRSPEEWWESYTRIPAEEWERWGVKFITGAAAGVAFTWGDSCTSRKIRLVEQKAFVWDPVDGPSPPIWPACPDVLGPTVWLTEGETDCGTLRHLGMHAFAITKGANGVSKMGEPFWNELRSRGARKLIIAFDADPPGQEAAARIERRATAAGIDCLVVDIARYIDLTLGQKDVRDLYLAQGREKTRQILADEVRRLSDVGDPLLVSHIDLLRAHVPETQWLIKNIWMDQTIGLMVGEPRVGKTWLALDAAVSVISGKRFLGWFEPHRFGPVIYVPREDSLLTYQSRLQKVFRARGLGGEVLQAADHVTAFFPPSEGTIFPLLTDTHFSFAFTDKEVSRLIKSLQGISREYGPPALVILDPLMRMTPGVDLFRADEVTEKIFETLDLIRREFTASVMVLHHKTKNEVGAINYYGSIAFRAFSESSIYLTKQSDDWVDALSEFKGAEAFEWRYRLGSLINAWEIAVTMGSEGGALRQRLLNALSALGGSGGADDLASAVGHDRTKIYPLLRELEQEGLVVVTKVGRRNIYGVA